MAKKSNPNNQNVLSFLSKGLLMALLLILPLLRGSMIPEVKYLSQSLILVVFACVLASYFFSKQTWQSTPFDEVIGGYILLITLSFVFAKYPWLAMKAFLTYLTPVVLFCTLSQVLPKPKQRHQFLVVIISLLFVIIFFGVFIYFKLLPDPFASSQDSLQGTYANKNHFAFLIELAVAILCGFLLYGKNITLRLSMILLMGILCVALILTGSRGAIFSVAATLCLSFLFVLLVSFFKSKALLLFSLIFLAVTVFFSSQIISSPQETNLSDAASVPNDSSWESRKSLNRSSLKMLADHPVFGVGIGHYELSYPLYREGMIDKKVDYAHNDVLQFVCEVGLGGILLLVFFLGRVFQITANFLTDPYAEIKNRPVVMGGFCVVLVVFFHSLTDFNLQIPANAYLSVAILSGFL